jgi:hypothetical protein
MLHSRKSRRGIAVAACINIGVAVWFTAGAFGVQTPHEGPATHERQCVPTGEIPPGDSRTITVTWKHPFATGDYAIIGSVSEPGNSREAIELGHIVIPYTPTEAAALVFNRNATAAQSAILCLDASTQ